MENATLNLMYEIPSDPTIEKCVITKGVITGDEEPVLTYRIHQRIQTFLRKR